MNKKNLMKYVTIVSSCFLSTLLKGDRQYYVLMYNFLIEILFLLDKKYPEYLYMI